MQTSTMNVERSFGITKVIFYINRKKQQSDAVYVLKKGGDALWIHSWNYRRDIDFRIFVLYIEKTFRGGNEYKE